MHMCDGLDLELRTYCRYDCSKLGRRLGLRWLECGNTTLDSYMPDRAGRSTCPMITYHDDLNVDEAPEVISKLLN